MKRKLNKIVEQERNSGDITIFGAEFFDPDTPGKQIITEQACVIALLALLVLAASCSAFVFSLHLF